VIAPSSLAFYTGNLFPQWKGSVSVGGLRGRMLDRLTIVNDKVVAVDLLLTDLQACIPLTRYWRRLQAAEDVHVGSPYERRGDAQGVPSA